MKIPDPAAVAAQLTDAASRAREVAEDAKAKFDATRGGREAAAKALADGFEATQPARRYALGVVTSDGASARSVPVDTGTEAPFRVGYGALPTLAATSTPPVAGLPDGVELVGARARVFGEASARTLSAAIGVEGEAGVKVAGRGAGNEGRPDEARSFGEAFLGARSREAAEVGVLGASVGAEAFAGGEAYVAETVGTPEDGTLTMQAQLQAGLRAAGHAQVGLLGASADERAEVGVRLRTAAQKDIPLLGPVGERVAGSAGAFAGVTEGAHAKAGLTGVGAGAEAFAGVRSDLEARLAVTVAGTELAGVGLTAEGWAGLGAKAEAGLGWDDDKKQVRAKADAGVAVGVGGSVGAEVTFGGDGLADLSKGSSNED